MAAPSKASLCRDVRGSETWREVERYFSAILRPGTGQISDASDIAIAPDGKSAMFAGYIVDDLDKAPRPRLCHIDMATGDIRVLSLGTHAVRQPKYAPDGRSIAFLSDRHQGGDFQLYLLDAESGEVRPAPHVDGWVEYLHWSPDGIAVLLGVAAHGADLAGGQGAIASRENTGDLPAWMPTIDDSADQQGWRRAWIYTPGDDALRPVGPVDCNVWEAVWCGNQALAAVISPGPGEGLWYDARLASLSLDGEAWQDLYHPADQLGLPTASPAGAHIAIVEAVCSDRLVVAGTVRLIDTKSSAVRTLDTAGVDISCAEWRSERHLLVAGHRGLDTVIGLCDTITGQFTEVWTGSETSGAGRYVSICGFGENGDCALIAEGFGRAPEIATIVAGSYRTIKSFDLGYAGQAAAIAAVEEVHWTAGDGLAMQGWLLRPKGPGPHPLVMNVHGGPVLLWKPTWLGRSRLAPLCLLVQHGYAIFLPNPRGSSGRGQAFARHVVGAMGGADAEDCLSGLDHLVSRGIADPQRLGVTGVSYGGFMAAWLVTQDPRFAAAVPIAPMTNFVTEHLLSNIAGFVKLFVNDALDNHGGRYLSTSPLLHAHKVTTPTLNICGGLDRCTPPEEAIQFHKVLLDHGVPSALALYPEEGHGINTLPAGIDFATRMIDWFEHFMPSR